MKKTILKTINQVSKLNHVDQSLVKKFKKRLQSSGLYLRDHGSTDHFCVFFLPFNKKKVYLGDHIKAGSWISPGGHIDPKETPKKTLKREFQEELRYQPSDGQIYPLDLSVIDIKHKRTSCRRHWDIWFLVKTPEIEFDFDKREYYQAEWFTINKALEKIKVEVYKKIILKLKDENILKSVFKRSF